MAVNEWAAAPANLQDPGIFSEQLSDDNNDVATLSNGYVDGSTFGFADTSSGLYNLYEDTPFYNTTVPPAVESNNVSDTFLYDPTGNPLGSLSGIDFGVQYLDLPDATAPVDEVNILGSGGDILLSIPVTGDLLSLF